MLRIRLQPIRSTLTRKISTPLKTDPHQILMRRIHPRINHTHLHPSPARHLHRTIHPQTRNPPRQLPRQTPLRRSSLPIIHRRSHHPSSRRGPRSSRHRSTHHPHRKHTNTPHTTTTETHHTHPTPTPTPPNRQRGTLKNRKSHPKSLSRRTATTTPPENATTHHSQNHGHTPCNPQLLPQLHRPRLLSLLSLRSFAVFNSVTRRLIRPIPLTHRLHMRRTINRTIPILQLPQRVLLTPRRDIRRHRRIRIHHTPPTLLIRHRTVTSPLRRRQHPTNHLTRRKLRILRPHRSHHPRHHRRRPRRTTTRLHITTTRRHPRNRRLLIHRKRPTKSIPLTINKPLPLLYPPIRFRIQLQISHHPTHLQSTKSLSPCTPISPPAVPRTNHHHNVFLLRLNQRPRLIKTQPASLGNIDDFRALGHAITNRLRHNVLRRRQTHHRRHRHDRRIRSRSDNPLRTPRTRTPTSDITHHRRPMLGIRFQSIRRPLTREISASLKTDPHQILMRRIHP